MTELPKSPGQKPHWTYDQQRNTIREWFAAKLEDFDSVEITFEVNDDECECEDQPGVWTVDLCKNGKRFYAKHSQFTNAMWFCMEHANAKDREDYERWKSSRDAALSKLTDAEKRLLNLR